MVDLVAPDGRVWVLPDADPAGEHCAQSVLSRVAQHRFVRWVKLVQGQPTDLSGDEISRHLREVIVPGERIPASIESRSVTVEGASAP